MTVLYNRKLNARGGTPRTPPLIFARGGRFALISAVLHGCGGLRGSGGRAFFVCFACGGPDPPVSRDSRQNLKTKEMKKVMRVVIDERLTRERVTRVRRRQEWR